MEAGSEVDYRTSCPYDSDFTTPPHLSSESDGSSLDVRGVIKKRSHHFETDLDARRNPNRTYYLKKSLNDDELIEQCK